MLVLNVKLTFITKASIFTKDFTAASESHRTVLFNSAFQSVKYSVITVSFCPEPPDISMSWTL